MARKIKRPGKAECKDVQEERTFTVHAADARLRLDYNSGIVEVYVPDYHYGTKIEHPSLDCLVNALDALLAAKSEARGY